MVPNQSRCLAMLGRLEASMAGHGADVIDVETEDVRGMNSLFEWLQTGCGLALPRQMREIVGHAWRRVRMIGGASSGDQSGERGDGRPRNGGGSSGNGRGFKDKDAGRLSLTAQLAQASFTAENEPQESILVVNEAPAQASMTDDVSFDDL